MKTKIIIPLLITVFGLSISSCKKDWLDAKPDQSLVTLKSVEDLQVLLDNTSIFNLGHPIVGEQSADDYYVNSTTYQLLDERDKNVYTWASVTNFYANSSVLEWRNPYSAIFYANTVLEEVENITPKKSTIWNNVKGSALFYRAFAFYNLAQIFCKPYSASTAGMDLGLVLRLEPDVNLLPGRSTVEQTYARIITDLKEAVTLLPVSSATFTTRPTKPAAFAMLSRVYLSMEDYNNAKVFADSCLNIKSTLMDYSTDPNVNRSLTVVNSITRYNPEVIFESRTGSLRLFPTSVGSAAVDSILFQSYHNNDWRKTVFYRTVSGRLVFRGSYDGSSNPFNGLAVDEVFFIRAECQARIGEVSAAIQDLNHVLVRRWKSGQFVPYAISNRDSALKVILDERRKELCFRLLRWTDLRRLNKDPRFAISLKRVIGAQTYILPPNDNRYVLPIPNNEIIYNKIPQNPR